MTRPDEPARPAEAAEPPDPGEGRGHEAAPEHESAREHESAPGSEAAPGHEDAPTTEAERRIDAYVEAILAGARVPRSARGDLAEELIGHLGERMRALEAAGLSEAAAARRAIDEFGAAGDLAGDFGRTYHSQLWASTIGVLLAGTTTGSERPGIVRWLRLMLGIAGLFMVGGIVVFGGTLTPLRAVASVVAYGFALAGTALAYQGLAAGRRWSLWYAIAIAVDFIVSGLWMVANPAVPGTVTIPVGALFAGGILVVASMDWARLQAFTAESRPIGLRLTVALAASILLPLAVGPVLAAVPDPTQAGPGDVDVVWTMTCERGDVDAGGAIRHDRQRIDLIVDVLWRRADVLPQGLFGSMQGQEQAGDSAGYGTQADDPNPIDAWTIVSAVDPVDVEDGRAAGWFGASSPSVALLPASIQGGFTIAIDQSAIRPGHPIRASWLLTPSDPYEIAWPRVRGAYAHLDRFLLLATLGCGESVRSVEAPFAGSAAP